LGYSYDDHSRRLALGWATIFGSVFGVAEVLGAVGHNALDATFAEF
jgi:hypothetical protein